MQVCVVGDQMWQMWWCCGAAGNGRAADVIFVGCCFCVLVDVSCLSCEDVRALWLGSL